MVAHPVVLASKSFPSKTAALAWVRDEILHAYGLESVVADDLHDAVLRELLERDDDEGKSGVGVREFFIRATEVGDGRILRVARDARGIWIRRVDGTEVDWSYGSAIRQEGLQSDVKEALRAVVDGERIKFRDAAFVAGPVFCAKTGEQILTKDDAEVRYRNPDWQALTGGFAVSQGGWDKIQCTSSNRAAQIAGDLVDDTQREAWLSYWREHARPELHLRPRK